MKLILGTAEFCKTPYGEGIASPPSRQEIVKILNMAYDSGITTLDTSDQYDYLDGMQELFNGFSRIEKSRTIPEDRRYFGPPYYHYKQDEAIQPGIDRASVYTKEQLKGLTSAIIPVSINRTDLISLAPTHWYARSVFDRGRLLKEGYAVKDCLSFVKRQHPNGVIIGVNSVAELEEILKAW